MIFSPEVQHIISTYKIGGFLPLDKALHFLVGAGITILLRWRRVHFKYILGFLFIIELIKETHDFFVLNSTLSEQLLDFMTTFIYPTILWLTIKAKNEMGRDKK